MPSFAVLATPKSGPWVCGFRVAVLEAFAYPICRCGDGGLYKWASSLVGCALGFRGLNVKL